MFDPAIRALAEATLEDARRAGVLIVTVESCTGGLIAGALTAVPGSSDAVDGGYVTYSNDAKMRLGVPAELIAAHGAVSEPVARAMASAGRTVSQMESTVSVAVTGVAGPGGGSADKPVGLVHFCASAPTGAALHRAERFGDIGRDEVRLATVRVALDLLRACLAEHCAGRRR